MEYCKLQIGCMLIILYIMFIYYKECRRFRQQHRLSVFDGLLVLGVVAIFFDGLTAYTVNHLEEVNTVVNRVLHLFFLLSLDSFIFWLFIYMISITMGLPKKKSRRLLLYSPFLVNVLLVVVNIPTLQYHKGEISNYSMGVSAYTCFAMAGIYILLSLIIFFGRWRYIERHKRVSIFTYLLVLACITGYQMLHPQALLSSICVTIIVLGAYINQENPAVTELTHYHDEMIMGFATLVENKDGSTGGHIKRTTMYVKLLAEELRRRGYYKEILTKDYLRNLCMAAPMHDIGKISVPDAILQKPGRLTEEEFETIKLHTLSGGKIIQETFGHLGNEQYTRMAYEVARFHHEKWNGKGYPEGLKRKEIPLCARIMAIADVFDAVSEKRCYREAMPLDKCFEIIGEGSGQDFDPLLAEVFLDIRDRVEEAHGKINKEENEGGK
ncbi:MAG: HD domain-containing protein [Lachnospiraceae bacterium]|nr:HD domain-containing protein [Lachnospiraceae bacterium]